MVCAGWCRPGLCARPRGEEGGDLVVRTAHSRSWATGRVRGGGRRWVCLLRPAVCIMAQCVRDAQERTAQDERQARHSRLRDHEGVDDRIWGRDRRRVGQWHRSHDACAFRDRSGPGQVCRRSPRWPQNWRRFVDAVQPHVRAPFFGSQARGSFALSRRFRTWGLLFPTSQSSPANAR